MKHTILLSIFLFLNVHSNVLMEAPKHLSNKEIKKIAQEWNTQFTWNWLGVADCTFTYEQRKAGFAIRFLKLPVYFYSYRILPTVEEIKRSLMDKSYYLSEPLVQRKASPRRISSEQLRLLLKDKKLVFYTGAGISAGSVSTMNEFMSLLHMDQGVGHFLKEALWNPDKMAQAFANFCEAAIYAKPSDAHWALKKIAQQKSAAIITENVDLLQQRTGVEPMHAYSELLTTLSKKDLREIEIIVCIGLSHDDRGFLAWYKQQNPNGILIAIDLKAPNYLSNDDYLCEGDLQEILPFLASH